MKYLGRSLSLIATAALILTPHVSAQEWPQPLTDADFYDDAAPPENKVELGRFLFFDKVLSGTDSVSCGTCHSPLTGLSDGVSLGLGVGARGLANYRTSLGFDRAADAAPNRIVRNSKDLFNVGYRGLQFLAIDGDFSIDNSHPSGFSTPAGDLLPDGLDNLLAAQNMFPAAQPREQAGTVRGLNPITDAALDTDIVLWWELVAAKVAEIDEYVDLFADVYDDVSGPEDITFVHVANALAAFQIGEYSLFNHSFNRFLKGDKRHLSKSARQGRDLFYGKAGCSGCHSGPLFTDQQFWAISIPQIGPGRQTGVDGRDWGRMRISRDFNDKYKYLTPSLLNVALTGPWGHSGAYATLEAVVEHHLDPIRELENYDRSQAILPDVSRWGDNDFVEHDNLENREEMISNNQLDPLPEKLTKREIANLVQFLHSLTDPAALDLRHTIPMSVPSGLPVWD